MGARMCVCALDSRLSYNNFSIPSQVCTSSGGWQNKADDSGRVPYPWSNEYSEVESAPPNGTAVGSNTAGQSQHHRVADKVDSKDIEKAEHV